MEKQDLKEEIKRRYFDSSKHSAYQRLPTFVAKDTGIHFDIDDEWRSDDIRLRYVLENVDLQNVRSVTDIGANVGFFCLSLAHMLPIKAFAIEGNKNHACIIDLISKYYEIPDFRVRNDYLTLSTIADLPETDLALFLNVLHHVGHDFDKTITTIDEFREYASDYLHRLKSNAKSMLFQMGYNWGGNVITPIVARNSDAEKIVYTFDLLEEAGWEHIKVAYATREDGDIFYKSFEGDLRAAVLRYKNEAAGPLEAYIDDCNPAQFKGEFYRRPLILAHSEK